MTLRLHRTTSFSRTAGLWLRCFLGGAISIVLVETFFGDAAMAQVVVDKPLHIRHVQGYVTDEKGNAVAGAEVELLREGKSMLKMTADKMGWFQFDRASGQYVLRASAGASEAGRQIAVETSLVTLFCHKTLYVMVRTKGTCDDCSIRVYTSKRKLLNTVWQNTGHYY